MTGRRSATTPRGRSVSADTTITAANVVARYAPASAARRHRRLVADLRPRRRVRGHATRSSSRRRTGRPRRSTPQRARPLALHARRRTRASPASAQITNATPDARPTDGRVRGRPRRADPQAAPVATGRSLWTTTITRDPTHEKITSSLNVSRGLVIATTGGYIGDAPPYQGHVVILSERTGGSRTSGTRSARTGTG